MLDQLELFPGRVAVPMISTRLMGCDIGTHLGFHPGLLGKAASSGATP